MTPTESVKAMQAAEEAYAYATTQVEEKGVALDVARRDVAAAIHATGAHPDAFQSKCRTYTFLCGGVLLAVSWNHDAWEANPLSYMLVEE